MSSSQPSSRHPPPHEWGPHYWYLCRCVANCLPEPERRERGVSEPERERGVSEPERREVPEPERRERGDELVLTKLNFFTKLASILPCQECAQEYNQLLLEFPLSYELCSDGQALARWVEQIKAEITKRAIEKAKTEAKHTEAKVDAKTEPRESHRSDTKHRHKDSREKHRETKTDEKKKDCGCGRGSWASPRERSLPHKKYK
jgi:hypothetical protein